MVIKITWNNSPLLQSHRSLRSVNFLLTRVFLWRAQVAWRDSFVSLPPLPFHLYSDNSRHWCIARAGRQDTWCTSAGTVSLASLLRLFFVLWTKKWRYDSEWWNCLVLELNLRLFVRLSFALMYRTQASVFFGSLQTRIVLKKCKHRWPKLET